MNQLFKFLPIAFGLLLGWLLWNPPALFDGLGAGRYLVNAALCGLLLISFVPVLVAAALPRVLGLRALPETRLEPEMSVLRDRMIALGFVEAGPAYEVQMAPAATLLGLAHPKYPVYGAVFRTGTLPAKTSFDFVSMLDGQLGGLTTNDLPDGAALPAGDGGLRQVLPDQSMEQQFETHLAAIEYLQNRGIGVRQVSPGAFTEDFLWAMQKQREIFFSSPVRNSLVTFWRAATKRVPQIGPLVQQQFAQGQIERLLSRTR
ncbi:hypothetical protein ABI59_11455 [Acidobacteria bacterium Mor1]|nr:hypothetical protein ABI59_11455 [Acidobacteria bacterium Mor1]